MAQTRFNTGNKEGLQLFIERVKFLMDKKAIVDIKDVKKNRTLRQNDTYALWVTQITDLLNDFGLTYYRKTILGGAEIPYTPELVRKEIMIPIMKDLYGDKINSSAKLKTNQFEPIIDIVTLALAKFGIVTTFPSMKTKPKTSNFVTKQN